MMELKQQRIAPARNGPKKARANAVNLGSLLKQKSAIVFYIIMIALPVAQFCVFYIGVNFNSILLAFKDYDALSGEYSWVFFENFANFFRDVTSGSALRYSVKNSLIIYVVGLIVGVPLTLFFSYYVYKKMFLYRLARLFLFLPQILPSMVMVILFTYFVSIGFPAAGLPDMLANPDTKFGTLIFFNIWIGFGGGVLLYSGAMGQVSDSVIEAARLDGASTFREFFNIILPGIFPTITTFLVTGVTGIFLNQANLYSFYSYGADIRVYTLGYYLFVQVMGQNASLATYPYAAAAGITLTVIAVPLTMLMKYVLERFGPKED